MLILQGIELMNPNAAEEKLRKANEKYVRVVLLVKLLWCCHSCLALCILGLDISVPLALRVYAGGRLSECLFDFWREAEEEIRTTLVYYCIFQYNRLAVVPVLQAWMVDCHSSSSNEALLLQ